VGRPALTLAAATILLLSAMGVAPTAQERDPFAHMQALRLVTPVPAPDVAFRALDGRPARLSELRGRPVLLTFFTTW
jgi:cytochrome oxidase Cu insertion factor (SCO1/SenC/PrrC family)